MRTSKRVNLAIKELSNPFPIQAKIACVLGNGPSLSRYHAKIKEITHYQGASVWGVNRIFLEPVPTPIDYYVALDRTTWKVYKIEIQKLFALRYFCPDRYREFSAVIDRLHTFQYAHKGHHYHFATQFGEGIGHGHTSVFAAMQLAYMSGARDIHLFGVDFEKDSDGKTHCYGNRRWNQKSMNFAKQGIKTAIAFLKTQNVPVTIHSDLWHD